MSPVAVEGVEEELYPLQDMHGQHVNFIGREEINRLRREGVITTYGTKKRLVGFRLTVSLQRVAGYDYSGRSLVPSNFAGTRYIFRQKWSTEKVNTFIFRFKKLSDGDSNVYGLLRILTPPALESAVYTPRSEASDAERAADPGKERRQQVASLFQAVPIPAKRRTFESDEPERKSLNRILDTVPVRRPCTVVTMAAANSEGVEPVVLPIESPVELPLAA